MAQSNDTMLQVQQLNDWIRKNAQTPKERSLLARQLFDGVCEALLSDAPQASHIQSPNAVVEVVAGDSGALYRRYLEIEYDESDNGLRLIGENIAGEPVQIVFLSETALKRMHDLRGKGPDAPRCGQEE